MVKINGVIIVIIFPIQDYNKERERWSSFYAGSATIIKVVIPQSKLNCSIDMLSL